MVSDYGGETLPGHCRITAQLVVQLPVLVGMSAVDAVVDTVETSRRPATDWVGVLVRRGVCRIEGW